MRLFISLLIVGMCISGCSENEQCDRNTADPPYFIDKIIYSGEKLVYDVIFTYDDKGRVSSILRDANNGYHIEYKKGKVSKVFQLYGGFDREHTYSHFADRMEVWTTDPNDENYQDEFRVYRKNTCGEVTSVEFYRYAGTQLSSTIEYTWDNGNVVSSSSQNCDDSLIEYDDKPNPFYFLGDVFLNPVLSSRNNVLRDQYCWYDYTHEIEYYSNDYPKKISLHNLSIIFGLGMNAEIRYTER